MIAGKSFEKLDDYRGINKYAWLEAPAAYDMTHDRKYLIALLPSANARSMFLPLS